MNRGQHSHDKRDEAWQRANDSKEISENRRKIRAERKKFKRNQQPKGPRRKDWTPPGDQSELEETLDGSEIAAFERIMPRDENDRRRALEVAAFSPASASDADNTTLGDSNSVTHLEVERGMVSAIANAICRVVIGEEQLLCAVRGTIHATETGYTNAIAVGDQVLVARDGSGGGIVEKVLPRRTVLSRPDVFHSHLQQIVVANADQLLIVASWRDPIIWHELIDRYLIAAVRNRLPALICVNKVDLATSLIECEAEVRSYRELGIDCFLTSAQHGAGIEQLKAQLAGRMTVLAGLSGVGKSSLLTAVQPSLNLRVNRVSEHSGEGRHTTTQATILQLDQTTWVVDTPGIREFGLSRLKRSELAGYFPEIEAAGASCRFRNCSHHEEPGCCVKAAVAEGQITRSRYHSYRAIFGSLAD